jgi:hypothetical protein
LSPAALRLGLGQLGRIIVTPAAPRHEVVRALPTCTLAPAHFSRLAAPGGMFGWALQGPCKAGNAWRAKHWREGEVEKRRWCASARTATPWR